jgi:hypothetical protein
MYLQSLSTFIFVWNKNKIKVIYNFFSVIIQSKSKPVVIIMQLNSYWA